MSSKKEEIIAIASDALQQSGVNGFSFRDLADKVGIKSSSVHYHFKSKNDLFKAIVSDYRVNLNNQLMDIEGKSNSLKEALMAFIEMFEEFLEDEKLCVCGMLAAEKNHLTKEVCEDIQLTFSDIEKWLKSIVTKYSENTIPVDALTHLLISSLQGSLLIDGVNKDHKYFSTLKAAVKHFTIK